MKICDLSKLSARAEGWRVRQRRFATASGSPQRSFKVSSREKEACPFFYRTPASSHSSDSPRHSPWWSSPLGRFLSEATPWVFAVSLTATRASSGTPGPVHGCESHPCGLVDRRMAGRGASPELSRAPNHRGDPAQRVDSEGLATRHAHRVGMFGRDTWVPRARSSDHHTAVRGAARVRSLTARPVQNRRLDICTTAR